MNAMVVDVHTTEGTEQEASEFNQQFASVPDLTYPFAGACVGTLEAAIIAVADVILSRLEQRQSIPTVLGSYLVLVLLSAGTIHKLLALRPPRPPCPGFRELALTGALAGVAPLLGAAVGIPGLDRPASMVAVATGAVGGGVCGVLLGRLARHRMPTAGDASAVNPQLSTAKRRPLRSRPTWRK